MLMAACEYHVVEIKVITVTASPCPLNMECKTVEDSRIHSIRVFFFFRKVGEDTF